MSLRGRVSSSNQRQIEKSGLSDEESLGLFSGDDSNNDRLLDNLLRVHQPPGGNNNNKGSSGDTATSYSKWNSGIGTKNDTTNVTGLFGMPKMNGKASLGSEPAATPSAWMPPMASTSIYDSPRRTKPTASATSRYLLEQQDDLVLSPPSPMYDIQPQDDAVGGSPSKSSSKGSHLPLDQVIIFPTSPTGLQTQVGPTISRLRRQYRSGPRSVTDHGVSNSMSQAPLLGSHTRDGLDVNSILQSLGLNSDKSDSSKYDRDGLGSHNHNNNNHSDYNFNNKSNHSRNRPHARSLTTHANLKNPLHVRALFVICVMGAAIYLLYQETTVVSEHAKALRKMALRRKRHFLRHEEGVDRPIVDQRVLDHLNKFRKPNAIELMHVHGKVQTKHHGPEKFRDHPDYHDDAVKEDGKSENEELAENPNTDAKVGERFANVLSSSNNNQPRNDEQEGESESEGDAKQDPPSDALPPVQEEVVQTVAKAVENILVDSSQPRGKEIPFLWIIPRSGSGIVKNIASQCLGLTLASEAGAAASTADPKSLQVIDLGGNKFVNVNLATVPGIVEARNLHLTESGLAELVVSARFPEASTLFNPTHKGRVIALVRHPVERLISMFFHLKKHNVPVVAKLSIEEYAKSPHVENNWMTRMLSGKMTGEVGDFELGIAKKILQTKVVVGLLEQKELSMRRFEYYLGWNYTQDAIRQGACRKRILTGDYRTNEISSHRVKEGSQAWTLLEWQNKLDLKLYKYAKALFLQQGAELFSDMPES